VKASQTLKDMMHAIVTKLSRPGWVLLGVLLLAAAIRLGGVATWSLWEDEETSIYFSQRLEKPFAKHFPVFFVALAGLYEATGVSVAAGRVLAGAFGVASIGLTFLMLRRHVSQAAALVAALLLAVCLGHVFWSQSIRYYTLLAAVEVGAIWLFFEGCENRQYGKLVLAGAMMGIAMFVHFTAVLLLPAFVVYLAMAHFAGRLPASYGWKGWLAFGVPVLLGILAFTPGYLALRQGGATGPPPVFQHPVPLLMRIVAYYGVPMAGLAVLSLGLVRRLPQRIWLLWLCVAVVPNLELLTMGMLSLANVTWNHTFIAMFGCASLAGMTVAALYERGTRKTAVSLALAGFAYYGAFLAIYYTVGHGDRARWQEASAFLKDAAPIDPAADDNPAIFAIEPGVVAHYLGCPADQTQDRQLVARTPHQAPKEPTGREAWYLVRVHGTPEVLQVWCQRHCDLQATFEAHTGPIDRSVLVYRWAANRKEPAPSRADLADASESCALEGAAALSQP